MKNPLNEELNRFYKNLNYDIERIDEQSDTPIGKILTKLKPDLPLNEYSDETDSIILLQKSLVDMGFLKKDYGLNKDGVDGDYGGDTEKALYSAIKSSELTNNNVGNYRSKLIENKSKVQNTYSNFLTFFEKFENQGGVDASSLEQCKIKTTFPKLKWVSSKNKCHSLVDIATTLNSVMGEYGIIEKSSLLSVMMKEQGKGNKVCAPNNNYAGVQTDAGSWSADLNAKMTGQFCKKDRERLRTFASFTDLEGGLSFIKVAFKNKGWFDNIKDVSTDDIEVDKIDVETVSNKNSDIWQTNWNLKLDEEEYKRFKDYGYNSKVKNTTFTDKSGIYKKSVDSLTPEEKVKHDKYIGTYRSPEKIKKSWDSMNSLFKKAFNIFKSVENETAKF